VKNSPRDTVPGNVVKNAIFQLHGYLCQHSATVMEELCMMGLKDFADKVDAYLKKSGSSSKLASL